MYARSYDRDGAEEEARVLPGGYGGTAFESETVAAAEPIRAEEPAKEEAAPASLFSRVPFLDRFMKGGKGSPLGGLFSDTEDLILLGLFLLLLLSKEGDPLCAIAVLILFFSDKI